MVCLFVRDLFRWLYVYNSKLVFICRCFGICLQLFLFFDLARYHAEQELSIVLDKSPDSAKIAFRLPIRLPASEFTKGRAVAAKNDDVD